jgi:hypothetical protein
MTMNDEGNAFSGLGRPRGGLGGLLYVAHPLKKIMHRAFRSRDEWVNALVGPPLSPTLQWDDYAHLAPYRELAVDIASGAAAGRATGINLLLHGPVGSGKTELAKTFASRSDCVLWSVGEADDAGSEPSRGERLAALRLAQRLLSRRDRAMILFDEAEDLLAAPSPFGHDRSAQSGPEGGALTSNESCGWVNFGGSERGSATSGMSEDENPGWPPPEAPPPATKRESRHLPSDGGHSAGVINPFTGRPVIAPS